MGDPALGRCGPILSVLNNKLILPKGGNPGRGGVRVEATKLEELGQGEEGPTRPTWRNQ